MSKEALLKLGFYLIGYGLSLKQVEKFKEMINED